MFILLNYFLLNNQKKLCAKKVKNFFVLGNNNKDICFQKGGILCGEDNICIINETHCPQYDDLTIKIIDDENSILYSKDIRIENICQKNSYYKSAYFIIEILKIPSKIIAFFIDYFYSINGI